MTERPSQTKQILDEVRALSTQLSEVKIDLSAIKEQIKYQPRIDSQRFENLEKNEINCKTNYDKQLTDHDQRISVIEGKSGKRWDLVIAAIISSGVSAFIFYLTR